jgi:hypothetical protein
METVVIGTHIMILTKVPWNTLLSIWNQQLYIISELGHLVLLIEGIGRKQSSPPKLGSRTSLQNQAIETDPVNHEQIIMTVPRLLKNGENGSPVLQIVAEKRRGESEGWVSKEYPLSDGNQKMKVKMDLDNAADVTTYYFRVRMKNDVGLSEASDVVELKTSELYPGPPDELKCVSVPEKREGIISWSSPSVNPSSVMSYRLQYKMGESGNWNSYELDKSTLEHTAIDLEPAMPYYVRVKALNPAHEGNWAEAEFTTKAWKPSKPTKPAIETDPVNHEQVFMTVPRLPKNEENGSPVLKIVAEKCRGESEEWVCKEYPLSDGNQKMKVKIDLDNAADVTTYYFRVRMKNDVGLSEASDVVELKTSELYPGPPDELKCVSVPEKREGIIPWSSPSINPSSAMSYKLQYKQGESGNWNSYDIDESTLEHTAIDLEPAMSYYVRVRALNPAHEGNWREAEFTTKAWKPNKPMKPTIEVDPDNYRKGILGVQLLTKSEENGSRPCISNYCTKV